jgi:4-hydroxyproline epimerase
MNAESRRVTVIDTHTGGEPTRVVVSGGPDLGSESLDRRRALFRNRFDDFRAAIVNEPRGSDVMVGALLVEPVDPASAAGVIFVNNVGYLGMCGHGTVGVVVALGHLDKIKAGKHRLETPVGTIDVEYDGANAVSFENVPSYRHRSGVTIQVPDVGTLTGDVAWGGNWFFLVRQPRTDLALENAVALTEFTTQIRQALAIGGITGADGAVIDHVELYGPPADSKNHSRNFVLCPGLAYDRSPCGTGTSAKVACLAADGKLRDGEIWRQESIVGSVFEASYRRDGDKIIPRIRGTAYVTAEATLVLDPRDPFVRGFQS